MKSDYGGLFLYVVVKNYEQRKIHLNLLIPFPTPFLHMVDIEIDLQKSVEQNAGIYFERAKKAKKKAEGTLKALEESRKKLAQLQKEEHTFVAEEEKKLQKKDCLRF